MGKTKTRAFHSNRHDRIQQKAKRNTTFLAIFITAIMVLSAFGVMLYNDSSSTGMYTLGQFQFQPVSGEESSYWQVIKSPDKKYLGLAFYALPVENFESEFNVPVNEILAVLKPASYVYISIAQPQTSDDLEKQILQSHEVARYELSEVFTLNDVFPISAALSTATVADQPIVTCENATAQIPVIVIKDISSDSLAKEGIFLASPYCVEVLASTPYRAIQLADTLKFVYIQ